MEQQLKWMQENKSILDEATKLLIKIHFGFQQCSLLKITIQNLTKVKHLDIKVVRKNDEIPLDMVINWDETGIHYV